MGVKIKIKIREQESEHKLKNNNYDTNHFPNLYGCPTCVLPIGFGGIPKP